MASIQAESPSHQSQPIIYEIVVSEQLPCFDPSIFVKQLLMSRGAGQKLGRFGLRHRNVIVLAYLVGLALRIIDMLLPLAVGKALAVVSVVFQFPTVFLGVLAFRYEYVKVLARTFEFCFLASAATLWVVCAFTYVQDLRAILLPVVWVDFINLVLAETYFGESKTVFVIATTSGLYLVLLTGKVSLTLSQSHISQAIPSEINSLTVKDALMNAMGTMVTLMIRQAYRKYSIMKHEQQGATWTQSISYRCRIALQSTAAITCPARALVQHSPTTSRRLPMRFIKVPVLFNAQNTVYSAISNLDLQRWQLFVLYGCGALGYAMSTLVLVATRSDERTLLAELAISIAAITGLSTTLLFRLYFASCCQRQLLSQLWTSFDFVFLFVQLIASEVSACDLLKWNWKVCCAVFAELLWVTWVLLLDALTPCMKVKLRLKTWHGVLVLVLHLAKELVFLTDVLVWRQWSVQNRVLIDTRIGGYKMQFSAFPFLFSRQVTILIWCVRILHRILTKHSANDLVMLLGNVEYDCQQRRGQQPKSIVPETTASPDK